MEISRRSFIGLSGIAGAGALFGLAGCAPTSAAEKELSATGEAAAVQDGTYSWETAPAPIAESEIAETMEADIVVVGAGMAGCVATLTAIQDGASVICLQKHSDVLSNGAGWAAWNSQAALENGFNLQAEDMFNTWNTWSENRLNKRMYEMWIRESGPTMDWMVDILGKEGITVTAPGQQDLEAIENTKFQNKSYMVAHSFTDADGKSVRAARVCAILRDEAESLGAQFLYSTPAVQLVRGADGRSGRVEAVIAQAENGSYLRVNATKGVILCAGDYANNYEMREKWLPHVADLPSPYMPPVNTGDGDLMAMWVGGHMDRGPHCSNIHIDQHFDDPAIPYAAGTPWLHVNVDGERYCNEDMPYQLQYAQDINQREHHHFQIYDSNFEEYWPKFPAGSWRGSERAAMLLSDAGQEDLDKAGIDSSHMSNIAKCVEIGVVNKAIVRADSLEELADALGLPVDAFLATVDRYNEMVAQGHDSDYGKDPQSLYPIEKAPFYGVKGQFTPLGVLSGIDVDPDMRVLDEANEPIEGLFAAGNNSGGNFFAGMVQPMCAPAMTLGRAITTGRVAVRTALG